MTFSRLFSVTLFSMALAVPSFTQDAPELVSLKKIWDQGDHNAFTDLIRFTKRGIVFLGRGPGHVKGNGCVRVIGSDGDAWTACPATGGSIDCAIRNMPDAGQRP